MILDYIIKNHFNDLLSILSQEDILSYYKIEIDFLKLFETYPDVGDDILCKPIETLPACSRDLIKAQQSILGSGSYSKDLEKLSYKSLKKNVHARFFGLPVCPELHRTIFPKNVDLGCFLKVTGTVVRVTQAKMLEYHRKYICLKCKYENFVEADFEHRYVLKAPSKCSNPVERCRSTSFSPLSLVSREHCKDYQEIKIQEQVNRLSIGTIPGSMWVILDDDLVDCCKPGDDVHICGIVRRRWRPTSYNKRSEVELVLQANFIQVCNSQKSQVIAAAPDVNDCFNEFWSLYKSCPMKGRDQILSAICPQVYGLYLVKLALLLTVITGHNHIENDTDMNKSKNCEDKHSTNVRGQCHLLLVGDPGTGKSQLLRAGAELTPRSVFTSGAGSTKAGLTCSALREEGEWQLEAGALVLSDGGVCCVDELAQLREHDRAAIHEAMEQQTISIAKAGIVCKLNTRCAVIAACNPRGHYQPDEPLSHNVALGTPLLSRFDLIFILIDSKNKQWDKLVSSYILFGDSNKTNRKQWSIEKLQIYISLIGPKPTRMTKSANIILQTYYMMQRKAEYRDPSRTTVRMLDSLVRLSQAHSRLMYRTVILPMDAIIAISLIDLSMQDCTLKDTVDALHSTFPIYPDFDYLIIAKRLLTRLSLYEIWNKELLYYGKLLNVDCKSLESEIDRGSVQLFAKFDNISDETIPLSSTIITSSYFSNTRKKDLNKEDRVNDRLVATLKKHATLNREDRKPTKITKKRKKKEVKVDSEKLMTKLKRKKNNKIKFEKSSDESADENTLLNIIPSGNDDSRDIGDNINQESPSRNVENNYNNLNHDINEVKQNHVLTSKNSVQDKLKQFKFVENHDLSKFLGEKPNCDKPELHGHSSLVRNNSNSLSSSQISIFETSDCDIDLDIL